MPRPTAAQIAYGSITVIFSTLAMLLLSQTSSAVGTAVIAVSALALGLLVAMTVPQPKPRVVAVSRPAEHPAEHAAEQPVPAVATGSKTAA
jgi:hydrogenase/urease accessory protein HupE